MEYYVFKTEQEAIDAELQIRQLGNFPLVGVNAVTGNSIPNKGLTTAWAVPQERLDGKWVFPRVPENLRDEHASNAQAFHDANTFTIENYSVDWFPQEEVF